MAIDVLGSVIEKATLQPLSQAVDELVLHPLEMRDTRFAIVDTRRLVVHYADAKPEPRRMADDDHVDFFGRPVAFSPARLLDQRAFPSGGAGSAPHSYTLTRSRVSGTGLMIAHYERAGGITSGDTALDLPSDAERARRERMKREG